MRRPRDRAALAPTPPLRPRRPCAHAGAVEAWRLIIAALRFEASLKRVGDVYRLNLSNQPIVDSLDDEYARSSACWPPG